MEYYKAFINMTDELKKDDSIAAILLIGKTARTEEADFNALNDVDLLVVYESNCSFERQIEQIHGVPFDISYISIFDMITQVEGRSLIWVNMMMGAKVFYAKNELVFGIIDRVKDIYMNGTGHVKDEDVKFIRFTLSQKLLDVKNRMKDEVVSRYLMHRLFTKVLDDYYVLNGIWPPTPKNIFENLEVVNKELSALAKTFIKACDAKRQFELLAEMVDKVLMPHGGRLLVWEKGPYNISK